MSYTAIQNRSVARWRFARAAMAVALVAACGIASAQSSGTQSIEVPFRGAVGVNGYTSASANVSYAFIACQGEIHIAYSLEKGPARVGTSYILDGTRYPVTEAPPTPVAIHFYGTVWRGVAQVGEFSDGLTGPSLGMGCFSGQTKRLARVADVIGPKATPSEVNAYLGSLSLQVGTGNVLRSAAQESVIRTDVRQAAAQAAADKRKAEQAAAAQAQEDAARRQLASASAAQASPSAAPSVARAPAASSGGTATARVTAPLTDAQRIANAIASDRVLADQRLAQQRDALARQQAAMAAADRQALEAKARLLSPESLQAVGTLANAVGEWNAQRKENTFRDAQARLAGKCVLPNGLPAPKDGEIQLGVPMRGALTTQDCGYGPSSRYKSYTFQLAQPMRLQFTIRSPNWLAADSFRAFIYDMNKVEHMKIHWSEWGAFQKKMTRDVSLPAGLYIVEVLNGYEDVFTGYEVRIDPVGG